LGEPSEQMQINKAATVTSREYRTDLCGFAIWPQGGLRYVERILAKPPKAVPST